MNTSRDQKDAATSQGTPGSPRGWRGRKDPPLEPPEGAQAWHPDSEPLVSKAVRGDISGALRPPLAVICYGGQDTNTHQLPSPPPATPVLPGEAVPGPRLQHRGGTGQQTAPVWGQCGEDLRREYRMGMGVPGSPPTPGSKEGLRGSRGSSPALPAETGRSACSSRGPLGSPPGPRGAASRRDLEGGGQ